MTGERRERTTLLIALFFSIVVVYVIALLTMFEWKNPGARQIVAEHFPVVVGIPFAVIMAFVIVAIFRSATGPIKFEAFGFKFQGASGETIMWVLCFLAITAAIKMLW